MSFCFLYNVVLENHSVQNFPGGGGGEGGFISSSRSMYRCQQHLRALDVTCNAKPNVKIHRGFYISAPCFIEFIKRVREKR